MPSSGFQTCALDRKSTRLNSSHTIISYAVFCLKKKFPFSVTVAQLRRVGVLGVRAPVHRLLRSPHPHRGLLPPARRVLQSPPQVAVVLMEGPPRGAHPLPQHAALPI